MECIYKFPHLYIVNVRQNYTQAIQRWFKLYECLLVISK